MFDRLLGQVKGFFNISTLIEIFISIICLMVGLILFTNSGINLGSASVISGLLIIAYGVYTIFSYFKRGTIALYDYNLIFGSIFIIFGTITFFVSKILAIFIGIYLLLIGIQRIIYALLFKKFNENSWIVSLGIGILLIVIAFIIFFTTSDSAVEVVGIAFLSIGAINLVNMMLYRKRSKYFLA